MTKTKKAGAKKPAPTPALAITLGGCEATVDAYRAALAELGKTAAKVDAFKESFRTMAQSALEATGVDGGPGKVAFLDSNGEAITVIKPDYSLAGSRLGVPAAALAEAEAAGIMGVDRWVEEEEHFVLKGIWAKWFRGYLDAQVSAGAALNLDGMEHKVTRRLSAGGVSFLVGLRRNGAAGAIKDAATTLLDRATKAFTVRS